MTEREKPNGREMSAIEYMAALDSQLLKHQTTLKDRLSSIPNGWRDYRLLISLMGRLLERLYSTLPVKTLLRLEAMCKNGEVVIRLHPPSRTPEYVLVLDTDLQLLINTAMAAECAICLKEGPEIKKCPLRKALDGIAPAYEEPGTMCAYQAVTLESEYGKYV